MTETQPEYLTIVHEVKDPIHRAQLLGGQWVSAAHGHIIAQMRVMEIELQKQIESRKQAQRENEDLKERIARGDIKHEKMRLEAKVAELQAQLDAVGAGGVEPLRSSKSNHFVDANKTMGAPSRWLNTI